MDRSGLLRERSRLSSLLIEQETQVVESRTRLVAAAAEPGVLMAKRLCDAVRNSIEEIDRMLENPDLNF
jgi:hypothetical protein